MKQIKSFLGIIGCVFFCLSACQPKQNSTEKLTELANPIIAGYFADPSIVQHEGKFYLYATADPWGKEFLSCWVSDDFQNWTFNKLNWPTKEACTSPLSNENMVWAPSIIKKGDTFYMYVSVGSEIWCGKANHPLGPWENMLKDKPLIPYETTKYYHAIDAEAFIDDDGTPYLYWGSGWDWTNGHCFAAELDEDMCTFKSEWTEVTPEHFFEGPLVNKVGDTYYLTYSEGVTMDDTYEVRYATSKSPMGPFKEAANSPILKTDRELNVYGPGHHTVFSYLDKNYILYHRHRLPFVTGTAYRQICINELIFDETTGTIQNITPYNTQSFPNLIKEKKGGIVPSQIECSSEENQTYAATNVLDNSYATLWKPSLDDKSPFLILSFEEGTSLQSMDIRFEYAWNTYYPKLEYQTEGKEWKIVADYSQEGISGSPVTFEINQPTKQLRLSFPYPEKEETAIWTLSFQ